ncbi:DUF2489 domain-containing protein [Saccharospirillum salsuginis]|uniref:DUF2489 domain-containing protein n=1 Tax=Saccharospirillum salsuginis TaxID=418750 RepID=A0A918NIJ1_9GAMM|nr:DUF2489 domain-containing protein [Saccharospirillum salsuginis]GGX75723.1 hypothetical protein GCM10007392_48530 [Saccharospirillum salsuginis]
MNTAVLISLTVVAVVVIGILATIAWRLQTKVWAQEKANRERQAELDRKTAERTTYVLDSLRIISANVIEEDLNLSEATIRCKVLIDYLELSEQERKPYSVLDTVFDKVQHFDTHDARKALSKTERREQDKAREAIEVEYENELKQAFSRLRTIGLN